LIRSLYGDCGLKTNEEEIVMRIKSTIVFSLIASLGIASLAFAAAGGTEQADGRSIAFDKKLGNCLACHAIPSDPKAEAPGNIGPPLVNMKQRYSDRAKLRAQIWDATVANPNTSMPPFGRNKILTEQEIDQVTDYIQGL
jgi:sulfur-oxidizing protein SoxX